MLPKSSRILLALSFVALALGSAGIASASGSNPLPVEVTHTQGEYTHSLAAGWCQAFASYTDWYNGKRALFVYRGRGNPNPYAVSVYYNGESVPNAGNGVQTYSGPQVDLKNGWVGYYVSTRWAWSHPNWNDDWRWEVRGCIR